jgi:homoserine dehydrogenase
VREVKVGLCGLGTVGSGVFNVVSRNLAAINARSNCQISIAQVGCRRDNAACDLSAAHITRDNF